MYWAGEYNGQDQSYPLHMTNFECKWLIGVIDAISIVCNNDSAYK